MMRSNMHSQFGSSSQVLLKQSDAPKPIQLACRYHPGSTCLNYCHEIQCFRLLCEQCIEEHLQHHKKTSLPILSIKSLKKVRQFCVDKLNRLLQQLYLNMNDLKQPKNPQQIIEQVNFKFQKVKNVMFEIIESQLNRFQEQIRNKVNQSFSTIKNLEDIHANLQKIIQQLAESKSIIIDGNRDMPDTMQKVLSMDDQVYRQSFARQVQVYSQKLSLTEFDISLNQGAFRNSVNECLKITKNQFKPQYQEMQISRNRNLQQKSLERSKIAKKSEKFLQPQIQSPIKMLHFLQNGSSYLHLLDFSMNPSYPKHSTVQLKTNEGPYTIPDFNASLLTKNAYVFLSGGIQFKQDQNDQYQEKNSLISKYSIRQKYFKQDFALVTPRSSHTMVQADQHIFIMGGYGQQENGGAKIQYTFEQINIKSGHLNLLPKSNYGGASISSLHYPYIIKASEQGVEAYSLPSNRWHIIKMQSPFNFIRQCGYSKLTQNSLFVYGGYKMNDQQGIDKCSIWIIQGVDQLNSGLGSHNPINVTVNEIRGIKLPKKGGFWSNPGIIINNSLYVLQNVEDLSTGNIIENKRECLQFRDQKWSRIKYQ